ncbi:hypothetical protein QBC40DRAFT_260458 [Triangularia verruculosa]|uniref:Uncharacterized protein n=1 Tax=Triangularia verruculosa TaxID=2587418 RepID=A0AAN7AQI9_9PEZI|nr:hypothetical protein QBC40DRAFT_260458 [Triangularia verruculosa]
MSVSSQITDKEDLYLPVKQCMPKFQLLEDAVSDGQTRMHLDAARNAYGRFKIWGLNLGAFRDPSSKSSINWRLRKATTLRAFIQDTLQELEDTLTQAISIFSGERPDRRVDELLLLLGDTEKADPENQELIAFLSSPTTEVEELFIAAQLCIDRLFKLSTLARLKARQRANNLTLINTPSPGDDPSFDSHMIYLRDKFPNIVSHGKRPTGHSSG